MYLTGGGFQTELTLMVTMKKAVIIAVTALMSMKIKWRHHNNPQPKKELL